MKLECKCHGVSGSCTLRTCWLAMSDFRKTGDFLRKKYNGAIEVTMNQDGTGFTVANKDFRKATKNDLVYFETSPDYCLMDKAAGKNEKKSIKWPNIYSLTDLSVLKSSFIAYSGSINSVGNSFKFYCVLFLQKHKVYKRTKLTADIIGWIDCSLTLRVKEFSTNQTRMFEEHQYSDSFQAV